MELSCTVTREHEENKQETTVSQHHDQALTVHHCDFVVPLQKPPSNDYAYHRHVSLELLNPTHDSSLRKSSPMSAMFNLVATVCGGGVLTLPMAFCRAGIIPTTVLMLFAAASSDFCLYILCSCARRTGARSYGQVCKLAFGDAAEIVINALLFLSLCGALVAFQVLVMQIWTQIYLYLVPSTSQNVDHLVLVVILIMATPLLLKRDLHALRHTCYVGFGSLLLLTVGLMCRATTLSSSQEKKHSIKWFSTNPSDLLFTFPIVTLCFYCSYNVLSVHGSLVNPTRERVKFVLDGAMLICLLLFYVVGLCGYVGIRMLYSFFVSATLCGGEKLKTSVCAFFCIALCA